MTSQYHAQFKLTPYTLESSGLCWKIGLHQEIHPTVAGLDFEVSNCEVFSQNAKQ